MTPTWRESRDQDCSIQSIHWEYKLTKQNKTDIRGESIGESINVNMK